LVTEDTIAERGIGQIEFLLCFQDLFAVQIVTGTAMQKISLLQLFKIAVHRLVVKRSALCFQVVRNRLGGKGAANIVEGVPDDPFQLIDLPHLIALYNV
jgi:hypothetical protein